VTEPVLDAKVIASLEELEAASGAPLLAPLVSAFLGDAPGRLAALQEALTRGDRSALGQQAHGLKGSAAALGVTRVASLAGLLERDAAGADLGGLAAAAAELVEAVAQARPALRALATGGREHSS
jgi:HPt (histidine-containing phosphotransfer) domain-containing protein